MLILIEFLRLSAAWAGPTDPHLKAAAECVSLVDMSREFPGAEYLPGSGGYFYVHRKSLNDPNLTVSAILSRALSLEEHRAPDSLAPASVLVLDFSLLRYPHLDEANIIGKESDAGLLQKKYADLSAEEKERLIFLPFLSKVESKDPGQLKLLHLDHHYDFPVLAHTSTTVLVADWIEWLIRLRSQPNQKNRAMLALTQIENAFRILDHSDADILLSHWISRRAQDEHFQARMAPVARAVALYNDHAIRSIGDQDFRDEVRFFYDVCLSLEQSLRDGKIRLTQAFQILDDAMIEADIVRLATWKDSFLAEVRQRAESPSVRRGSRSLQHWFSWAEFWSERTSAVQAVLDRGISDQYGLDVSHFAARGRVLIAWFKDGEPDQDTGSLLQILKDENSDVLNQFDAIVLSSVDLRTGRRGLKVRAMNSDFDLNPIYRELRDQGLDAGGRAAAGAAAFGKNGAGPEQTQEVLNALETTVRVLNERAPRR
jgi:hypothetical protein